VRGENINVENPSFMGDSDSDRSYLEIKKSAYEDMGDPQMTEHAHEDDDPELDELVSLNFKISERERREFKVWCAGRGLTQVEAFKRGFRLLKEKDEAR